MQAERTKQFQSTLPARGATVRAKTAPRRIIISIHAPREGSDPRTISGIRATGYFNPRSPRGERPVCILIGNINIIFQSTLPARGATECGKPTPKSCIRFQSTLPARGATAAMKKYGWTEQISIHAPREGSDLCYLFSLLCYNISIHAPREGSDADEWKRLYCNVDFNPRSPRGERPFLGVAFNKILQFQSTLPARGATRLYPYR